MPLYSNHHITHHRRGFKPSYKLLMQNGATPARNATPATQETPHKRLRSHDDESCSRSSALALYASRKPLTVSSVISVAGLT